MFLTLLLSFSAQAGKRVKEKYVSEWEVEVKAKKSMLARHEKGQAGLPKAIHQAEPENRIVFPEEPIREPATEQRKKVNTDDERVENLLRRRPPRFLGQISEQRGGKEHRQDVAHPVKAEPLATFVANDVTDLSRYRGFRVRHRRLRGLRQLRIDHIRLHSRERRQNRAAAQPECRGARRGERLPTTQALGTCASTLCPSSSNVLAGAEANPYIRFNVPKSEPI